MLHQESKEGTVRTGALWKDGGKVHPRAQGQYKGPRGSHRLGELRGEPKGKGREGSVRSALERWPATAEGPESEAGVLDHSPGVERCRRFRDGS